MHRVKEQRHSFEGGKALGVDDKLSQKAYKSGKEIVSSLFQKKRIAGALLLSLVEKN